MVRWFIAADVDVCVTEDPEYDGGSAVVEYLVTMNGDTSGSRDVYRGHDTQCTVASLLPGRLYTFQVKANNKAGVGPLFGFSGSYFSFAVIDCVTVILLHNDSVLERMLKKSSRGNSRLTKGG